MKNLIAVAVVVAGCTWGKPDDIERLEDRFTKSTFTPYVERGELGFVIDIGAGRETLANVGKRWLILQAYPREVRPYEWRDARIETSHEMRRVMVGVDGDVGWMVLRDG